MSSAWMEYHCAADDGLAVVGAVDGAEVAGRWLGVAPTFGDVVCAKAGTAAIVRAAIETA
jgi:hypothetical protein